MISAMATATVEETEEFLTVGEMLNTYRVHCGWCGVRKTWIAWFYLPAGRVEGSGDKPSLAVAALLEKIGGTS